MAYNYTYTPMTTYWTIYWMNRAHKQQQDEEKNKVPVEIKVESKKNEQQSTTTQPDSYQGDGDKVSSDGENPNTSAGQEVVMNTADQTITLPSGDIYKYMSKCLEQNQVLVNKQVNGQEFTEAEINQLVECAYEKHNNAETAGVWICGIILAIVIAFIVGSIIF